MITYLYRVGNRHWKFKWHKKRYGLREVIRNCDVLIYSPIHEEVVKKTIPAEHGLYHLDIRDNHAIIEKEGPANKPPA